MRGPLHELDEHVGGEFVGLVADGDADDGELFFSVGGRRGVATGVAFAGSFWW